MRLAIIWYSNVYWGCSGKIVFSEDTGNDEKKNYSFLLAMADWVLWGFGFNLNLLFSFGSNLCFRLQ